MTKHAVVVDHLQVNYGKTSVLWNVSFQIPSSTRIAIVGPNGAGKSTLLQALLGVVTPSMGEIVLLGSSLDTALSKVAYVPQKNAVDWNFPINAEELVLMGAYGKSFQKKEARIRAYNALEKLEMGAFAKRQIGQLSGGQQQRLFIARALMQEAELFLLDEPFSGVDLATEKKVVETLHQETKKGKTMVAVHHDLPTVPHYFDWVILLNTTVVAFGPIREVFTQENLEKTFGKEHTLFQEASVLSAQHRSGDIE